MSNKAIFDALVGAGMTVEGACGMLGNMAAESTMKPTIAQRGMTTMSDSEYTFAADNGSIDFANDSVGYGLCQWTYHTRKAALLAFAKSRGVSVGDGDMQTQFCIKELQTDYPDLWAMLCSSHDLLQCTERICKEFERPAVNNVEVRYGFAKQAFDYFSVQPCPADKPPDSNSDATDSVPDACPIDGPCDTSGIDSALAALAAYIQTEQFKQGFMAFCARKE